MEPPKQHELELFEARGLTAEFEEYQALLSRRFEQDPSAPEAEAQLVEARIRDRLAELAGILYPDSGGDGPSAATAQGDE